MNRSIKVCGKTSPYEVMLQSHISPFAVDEYLVIEDSNNNNPLCRIVSSEVLKNEDDIVYSAIAKVESIAKYPIAYGAKCKTPSFEDIKPFVMRVEPENGFCMGEVCSTAFDDIPSHYTDLMAMYDNGNIVGQNGIPFIFDYKKLFESPHIGLFGGSGSGKTVALKVIIEELMNRDIPCILLDPHLEMNFSACKQEVPTKYHKNFGSKFEIFVVGHDSFGIDFSDLSTDELISIMSFSGELSGPMDSLLRTLHRNGNTLYEIRKLIDDLIAMFQKLDQGYGDLNDEELRLQRTYSSKVPSFNTLIALSWRLNSLEQSGIFNGNTQKFLNAMENRKVCVLRGSMDQIHIVASHLIEKAYMKRRAFIDARENSRIDATAFPPFFIAMDEAHLFCPNNAEFSLTRRIITTIAQEGRKYGVFEVLATQRPSLLSSTIVAQIANKFIFRLSIKEDLESIKKETDLNDAEIKKLPYMRSGECYVSSSVIGRTVFVKIRYGITTAKSAINPFDELGRAKSLTPVEQAILEAIPFNDLNKMNAIKKVSEKTGVILTVPELTKTCEELSANGLMIIEDTFMGKNYIKK
jgi:DNA helicase HerA-like ATPase